MLPRRIYEYRGSLLSWNLWHCIRKTQNDCNSRIGYLNIQIYIRQVVPRSGMKIQRWKVKSSFFMTASVLVVQVVGESGNFTTWTPFMNGCRNCWRDTAYSVSEPNSFHFKLLFKIREAIFSQFFKLLRWGWGWWWWIAHFILLIYPLPSVLHWKHQSFSRENLSTFFPVPWT